MKRQRVQNGQAAARRNRHSAAPGSVSGKARPSGRRLLALLRRCEEGQALVETALVFSILLLPLVAGIFVLSTAMYQKMLLETATSQGIQTLALSENISATNPCTAATTAIQTATSLNSANIGITLYNGAAPPGAGTAISGSTCVGLIPGTQVSVQTTYPCSLAYFKFMSGCQIVATQSEAVP